MYVCCCYKVSRSLIFRGGLSESLQMVGMLSGIPEAGFWDSGGWLWGLLGAGFWDSGGWFLRSLAGTKRALTMPMPVPRTICRTRSSEEMGSVTFVEHVLLMTCCCLFLAGACVRRVSQLAFVRSTRSPPTSLREPKVHPPAVRCDTVSHQLFRARRVRKNGSGGEVRHGITSGVSCETSKTQNVTPHLLREYLEKTCTNGQVQPTQFPSTCARHLPPKRANIHAMDLARGTYSSARVLVGACLAPSDKSQTPRTLTP